jgi:uncharacterized protein (TIGR03067 family)
MAIHQVHAAGLRLADAQSVIARQSGFASWPALARHVDQLRALEGTWSFVSLEVDGTVMPPAAISASRILIDGDRFRTESPEATYEGTFNIDVEADPHEIDIDFVEGPEAGTTNHGIFRLDGDQLELGLDLNGGSRPVGFRTARGSGHAYEVLRRTSRSRPESVTGGTLRDLEESVEAPSNPTGFDYVESPTLLRLQGEWAATELVLNGQALPASMLGTGRRSVDRNEVRITFGGQVMVHALIRVDVGHEPMLLDYYNLAGPNAGKVQLGILAWQGDESIVCMAATGRPRPTEFASAPGSGHTLSRWRSRQ